MQIRDEHDALAFLLKCIENPDYGNDDFLSLQGCHLRIKLEPGDGSADRYGLKAFDLLQRHLDLTYLLAKTGKVGGSVTNDERKMLSIKLEVLQGSTIYLKAATSISLWGLVCLSQ